MGKRQTIYNACNKALDSSTSIAFVTQQMNINMLSLKEDKYPAVRLTDGPETKSRFAYLDTTSDDMQSEFSLEYVGYVRSIGKSSTDLIDEQNNLLVGIEKALTSDTALSDQVADIIPNGQASDKGNIDGIGWIRGEYIVTYFYNHNSP